MTSLEIAIAQTLASDVAAMTPLSGGDVAQAFKVELVGGRTVFAKTKADAPPNFFSTEAAGLEWLAEPGLANVANVLAVADDEPPYLVLEWIDIGGPRSHNAEAEFGRSLAELHRSGAETFGRTDKRTTGSLALPNDPAESWAEFYATNRLRPLATIASQRNALAPQSIDRLLDVADKLNEFETGEPSARLHGDLWAGNRVVDTAGSSWLIDPAAHGGHREFDLAMMRLFGGFAEECFSAYDEAFPLAGGWQERVPLHQLAPLVVHAIKFGGHYGAGVDAALASLS